MLQNQRYTDLRRDEMPKTFGWVQGLETDSCDDGVLVSSAFEHAAATTGAALHPCSHHAAATPIAYPTAVATTFRKSAPAQKEIF